MTENKIGLFYNLGFKLYKKINDLYILEYKHHIKPKRFHKGNEIEKMIMVTGGEKYFKIYSLSNYEKNKKIMIYKNRFNNLLKPKEVSFFIASVTNNLMTMNEVEEYLNTAESQNTKYFSQKLFEENLIEYFATHLKDKLEFENTYFSETKKFGNKNFSYEMNIHNFISNDKPFINKVNLDLNYVALSYQDKQTKIEIDKIIDLENYLNEYRTQIQKYKLGLK
jgi:hypothetical protein